MGLIKTIMVLRNGQAPPNLNFTTLRPDARVDPAILSLPCKATGSVPVEKTIGGVNSFGAGGTNAHAVVEAWTGAGSEKVVVDRVHSYPNMKWVSFFCPSAIFRCS